RDEAVVVARTDERRPLSRVEVEVEREAARVLGRLQLETEIDDVIDLGLLRTALRPLREPRWRRAVAALAGDRAVPVTPPTERLVRSAVELLREPGAEDPELLALAR